MRSLSIKKRVAAATLTIASAALAAIVLSPAFTSHQTHCGNRQLTDATQIRGIHQGMIAWAEQHATNADAEPGDRGQETR